jgi:hypothetical protein
LFVRFSRDPHALAMFTEGLDRDALKWVREVSELAAPSNPSWFQLLRSRVPVL